MRGAAAGAGFLRECVWLLKVLITRLETVTEKMWEIEGRICFTKTNSVAAGGANASAFGPTAGSTLQVSCFFTYGFFASGQDIEMAHTSPPREPGPPFT